MRYISDEKTERIQVVSGSLVMRKKGEEIAKVMNYVTLNTFIKYYLRVGDRYFQVLYVTSNNVGDLRLTLKGTYGGTVPWDTVFAMRFGETQEEFSSGIRPGCFFPSMRNTGSLPDIE